MEKSFDTMVWVTQTYDKKGGKSPHSPRIDVDILNINNRVASVKLTTDGWINYMHLYKTEKKEWKIINVLWLYHDPKKNTSK
jgi:hypothetical protein